MARILTLDTGSLDTAARGRLCTDVHPVYKAHQKRWALLLDAFDGEGGFLDGGYLVRFPRELDAEFAARRSHARFHNFAMPIVDLYTRKVCTGVTRSTTDPDLQAWWTNVDGAGTGITDYLRGTLGKALAAGHCGVLVDKTRDIARGPSRSDERATVFLTRYLPSQIPDWRLDRDDSIAALKLWEPVESRDLLTPDTDETRALVWDRQQWLRVPRDEQAPIEHAEHGIGVVPFVVVRPKRSESWRFIGASILGDGSLLTALYNRASEEDDVIRNQAFSVLCVQVPPEKSIEDAKREMGHDVGTTRALFTYGTADYKAADMRTVDTIRENQKFLVRELYRMAHVRFENDSRDAQSAESVRLQNQELGDVLSGVAAEMLRVDLALAKLYFAWTSPTPALAEERFKSAAIKISYPFEFFERDPREDIETRAVAMRAVDSRTFDREIKKTIVLRTAPELDAQTREAIFREIEAGVESNGPLTAKALRRRAADLLKLRPTIADDDDEDQGVDA